MKPVEASKKEHVENVYANLYDHLIYLKPKKSKFAIGNKIRISKYKRREFDKGYTPNWREEIFTIDEVLPTKPLTYKIADLMGEAIEGSFYLTKNNNNKFVIMLKRYSIKVHSNTRPH